MFNTLTVRTWDLMIPRPSWVLVTNPDRQLPCHFSKTVLRIPSKPQKSFFYCLVCFHFTFPAFFSAHRSTRYPLLPQFQTSSSCTSRFWAYCNILILSSKPPRCKHFLPMERQVRQRQKAAAQKVQRLCGASPHSQRSEMIHHIPGRLIRPSRCSNTISMVFSFQTVRFSRTAPSVKTEAA